MALFNFRQKNSESGQVLLLVVLVGIISLTVGLAAVSRSVTNTRVSTEESNSQKALNAAEAGLEEQIRRASQDASSIGEGDNPVEKKFGEGTSFNSTIRRVQGRTIIFNNGELPVSKSEGADIWLSSYPNFDLPSVPINPVLDIYWKNENGCGAGPNANPAVEIIVLRGPDKNNPTLERYAVDGCPLRSNGFDAPTQTGNLSTGGKPFNNRFRIPGAINNGFIVRVIPIYNDAFMGAVSTNVDLPAQGFQVESEGISGETRRKVKVFQSFPTVPIEIFPYNLFNP